jgi:MFS family permease
MMRQFNLLWLGQTVSNVGDKINVFVIPTVMILLLGATPFQVGLVGMAQYLAIPLLSLVAGVLVDRWNLRRTLISCDVIRFAVIAIMPLAYWMGILSIPLVFACVAIANATSVFFNIGYTATISAIVPVDGRVQAYSRLETSRTGSEVIGPAIGSLLYAFMGVAALLGGRRQLPVLGGQHQRDAPVRRRGRSQSANVAAAQGGNRVELGAIRCCAAP